MAKDNAGLYSSLNYYGAERIVKIMKLVEVKMSSLNAKQVLMKEIVDNKVYLGSYLYWTHTQFTDLLVDVSPWRKGVAYPINRAKYEVLEVSQFNVKYRCRKTGRVSQVFDGVRLNFDVVEITASAQPQSTHGYPAISFRYVPEYSWENPYKRIKTHFLVKGMTEGHRILLAMGESGSNIMEVHHIEKFKLTQDNSDNNLLLVFDEEHSALPALIK
jgi:hypothetical protein